MAKKKRGVARRHHYRRVGSTHAGTGSMIIGLAVGSVAAKVVHNTLGGIPPKISSGIMCVGGLILADKSKSAIMKGAGYGIASVGVSELMTEFGIVHGIGGAMYNMLPGVESQQVIAGHDHTDPFSSQMVAGAGDDYMGGEDPQEMHHAMMHDDDMLGDFPR